MPTFVASTTLPSRPNLYSNPSICRRTPSASTPVPSRRTRQPRVCIEYCTGCRWGLRAGWMAQELLVTFERDLGEVALQPGNVSGVFDVWVADTRVWCRKERGRFPELKEVKQLIRDVIAPEKTLGHSDKPVA